MDKHMYTVPVAATTIPEHNSAVDADATAGFTLIETLVAGILIVLSVFAVVSVFNTGSMLETSDNYRRQARAIIRSVFEQHYDVSEYYTIPVDTAFSENVVIDERNGNALNGRMSTRIFLDSTALTSGAKVPAKNISISCRWVDVKGVADSIVLAKLITKDE
jgi:type II secretory pathway pseudopilin PulG